MSISKTLIDASIWLGWSGLFLTVLTLLFFIFNWGGKFRLIGATIFTFLLSISCWAFTESYRPPFSVDGAIYAPVVYDNGADLVVAQASKDFPEEAIGPTLEQIAGNLKGGGANRSIVNVRLRKLEPIKEGVSKPVILGEVLRDVIRNETLPLPQSAPQIESNALEIIENQKEENIIQSANMIGIKENELDTLTKSKLPDSAQIKENKGLPEDLEIPQN